MYIIIRQYNNNRYDDNETTYLGSYDSLTAAQDAMKADVEAMKKDWQGFYDEPMAVTEEKTATLYSDGMWDFEAAFKWCIFDFNVPGFTYRY